jgi:hypothetical protein
MTPSPDHPELKRFIECTDSLIPLMSEHRLETYLWAKQSLLNSLKKAPFDPVSLIPTDRK